MKISGTWLWCHNNNINVSQPRGFSCNNDINWSHCRWHYNSQLPERVGIYCLATGLRALSYNSNSSANLNTRDSEDVRNHWDYKDDEDASKARHIYYFQPLQRFRVLKSNMYSRDTKNWPFFKTVDFSINNAINPTNLGGKWKLLLSSFRKCPWV